jgi:hypothetical protein
MIHIASIDNLKREHTNPARHLFSGQLCGQLVRERSESSVSPLSHGPDWPVSGFARTAPSC